VRLSDALSAGAVKHVAHRVIDRRLEARRSVVRHDVRVSAEQRIDDAGLEVAPERIDRIRAVETEALARLEAVPELFEADRSGELPLGPQQPDELAERANVLTRVVRGCVSNCGGDDILEALRIGPAGDHDPRERLLGIEDVEQAFSLQRVRRPIGVFQLGEDGVSVRSRREEHRRATNLEPVGEILPDVTRELTRIGGVEL
jgi:hypothetical protein